MIPRDLHYAYPQAAWLLPLTLVLLLLLFLLYDYRQRFAAMYGAERYREKVLTQRSRLYSLLYGVFIALVWGFAVLALMQPQGQGRYQKEGDAELEVVEEVLSEEDPTEEGILVQRRRKAHDLIFLLDTSASMEVADTPQGIARLHPQGLR